MFFQSLVPYYSSLAQGSYCRYRHLSGNVTLRMNTLGHLAMRPRPKLVNVFKGGYVGGGHFNVLVHLFGTEYRENNVENVPKSPTVGALC